MNLIFSGVNRSSYTNSANLLKEGNHFKLCLKILSAFSYNKINVNATPFASNDTSHVLKNLLRLTHALSELPSYTRCGINKLLIENL